MHRQVFSRALISSTKHIELLLMYVCCHSVLRPDVIIYFDPTAKGGLISESQMSSRTFYRTVLVLPNSGTLMGFFLVKYLIFEKVLHTFSLQIL